MPECDRALGQTQNITLRKLPSLALTPRGLVLLRHGKMAASKETRVRSDIQKYIFILNKL